MCITVCVKVLNSKTIDGSRKRILPTSIKQFVSLCFVHISDVELSMVQIIQFQRLPVVLYFTRIVDV